MTPTEKQAFDAMREALEAIDRAGLDLDDYINCNGKSLQESLDAALIAAKEVTAQGVEPDPQLCKFYDVTTFPELVAAMEAHILRLQAKLPKSTEPFYTTSPRVA